MQRYQDKNWAESMRIKFDFNNMMTEFIGEQGINVSEIDNLKERAAKAFALVKEKRASGKLAWMDLPYSQGETVKEILKLTREVRENFNNFVLIGIGGQALGPIAVQQALNHMFYNELPQEKRGGPKFYVTGDNSDPERLNALLDIIDVSKTKFFISSKSGSTPESASQFLIVANLLKQKLGENYKNNIICTTNSEKGDLIQVVKKEGFKWFVMPEGVGGRYSELSSSGLFPAAACGIDIEEMLAGGAFMDTLCSNEDMYDNPALMSAVLQYIAMKKGKNISVLMPYADSLKYIADWYAQLWAESLGKKVNNHGEYVFAGQTPVKALGSTDQHSQVQLYTEGPFDKVITFIRINKYRNDVTMPLQFEYVPGYAFFAGHTLSELIKVEEFSTEHAITKSKHMNNTIIMPEINAFTIGQLLYMFETQTAFEGELLEVDAYNQPGVQEGKDAAFAILGSPGYEEKKAELNDAPKKSDRYII